MAFDVRVKAECAWAVIADSVFVGKIITYTGVGQRVADAKPQWGLKDGAISRMLLEAAAFAHVPQIVKPSTRSEGK